MARGDAQMAEKEASEVVLLSGGTSGIGLAAAQLLLARGAQVMLMGRSEERGRKALAELDAGERAAFVAGDVRHPADCRRAVRETLAHFGRLTGLVCSAGIYVEGALEDLRPEVLDTVLDINVKGTMYLCQAALPALKQAHGSIVNVASDAGVHGNYFCTAYCASKGAVVLFTRALALEVAHEGVRVNAIAPGDIMTPLTRGQLQASPDPEAALQEMASVYPLGRIGTPEEAAAVIAFLLSAQAGFVTGAVWRIDGGLTA